MSVLILPTTHRESSEQVKPLGQAKYITENEDEDEALSIEMNKYHNRTCLKWCGSVSAILLILSMIILILTFTAFHIKDPILNMKSAMIIQEKRETGKNLTFFAVFRVKNPNFASFRYDGIKTILYYDGVVLGETETGRGVARARRTIPVNVTVAVVIDDRIGGRSSAALALLPVSSYTEISGRVKISNIIKKQVLVKMNCTMVFDLKNWSAGDRNCKKRDSIY